MSPPSSRPPPGVPISGGNAKYAIVAVALIVAIGAVIGLRSCGSPSNGSGPVPSALVVPSSEPSSNPKLDDIPPPPPPDEKPEAGSIGGPRVVVAPPDGCEGKCVGSPPPELGQALQARAVQARRCYNQALAQDSTLRGHVVIAVRVGPSGNACTASVASNDMGVPGVANCAANIFRGSSYPSPRGGCVDATVPISFVPQGQ
jgi:hypothetical protein